MPDFEWSDQLTLAKELVERDDEAALRTVIYLTYYAAYNSMVAYLSRLGAPLKTNDHKGNWQLLGTVRRSKPQLVKRGQYWRHLRNSVSYDLDLPASIDLKEQARKAIVDVQDILQTLSR